jgi:allantoate deiminase
MHLRRDALAAAAEWITLVERTAQQTPGLVATVGVIEALPGAGNVIPGETKLRLDIRHANDAVRLAAIEQLRTRGAELADRRQVSFHFTPLHEHGAVAMDDSLTTLLEQCLPPGSPHQARLVSGAGHDAAVLARRFPTAMLFIRCRDGVSHHPDESVTLDDVTAALTAMWQFVQRLAAAKRNDA